MAGTIHGSEVMTETAAELGDFGADASEKVQESASAVAEKARTFGSQAARTAQQAAATAAQKTDEALSAVGGKITSLAGALREKVPHEGTLGSAATAVCDQIKAGGEYLQEHDLGDMAKEVQTLIRRHPIQSVFFGFGLGCVLGALTRLNRR